MATLATCFMLHVFALKRAVASNATNYTYWRYGDGQYHNALPPEQHLFSNGLLSSQPVMQSHLSFPDANTNASETDSNKILYPLITEQNELFVLRLGGTQCLTQQPDGDHAYSFSYYVQNCDLQIIKLDADLEYVWNHTVFANLTCFNGPRLPCIDYPIYHTLNGVSYLVLSYWNALSPPDQPWNFTLQSYLHVIDVTNGSTHRPLWNASHIVRGQDLVSGYWHQPTLRQSYIYYRYGGNSHYHHMVYELQDGHVLWSSTLHESMPWMLPATDSFLYRAAMARNAVAVQQTDGLIGYDVWSGTQIWNVSNIERGTQDVSVCNAVIHGRYHVLIGCLYNYLEPDTEAFVYAHLFVVDLDSGALTYSYKEYNMKYGINSIFLNEQDDVLLVGGQSFMRRYSVQNVSPGNVTLLPVYGYNASDIERYFAMDAGVSILTMTWSFDHNSNCYAIYKAAESDSFQRLPSNAALKNCGLDSAANAWRDEFYFYPVLGNENDRMYIISDQYQVHAYSMGHEAKRIWLYVVIGAACFVLCVLLLCFAAVYWRRKRKRDAAGRSESEPILAAKARSVNYQQ